MAWTEVNVGPATYNINIDEEIVWKYTIGSLLSDGGAKIPPEHSTTLPVHGECPKTEAEYLASVTIEDTSLLPSWEDVQLTMDIIRDKERRNWIEGQAIRNRVDEYPKWTEQLDYMYHNGFDAWKDLITNIKNKYPKQ